MDLFQIIMDLGQSSPFQRSKDGLCCSPPPKHMYNNIFSVIPQIKLCCLESYTDGNVVQPLLEFFKDISGCVLDLPKIVHFLKNLTKVQQHSNLVQCQLM